MCQLYNSSIPHQTMKAKVFQYSTEAFWDFLRRKNLNPYSNIESIQKFNQIYPSHK